ncbi:MULTISPECIES: hypothetical protein [Shewanella]|uniref:hypothetical protein n=1 Tax=Shewanella TaxID=22 RepID=UPI001F26F1FA|nr:hypothetical protein [Shewanella indica]MCE9793608.1 hypothetical protein [Shewanella indica]
MPYRPMPNFRRNIRGVIYPLTEAIRRLYGCRSSDGAYPLGVFYPVNVSTSVWSSAGGIWYIPESEFDLNERNPREESVLAFMRSIFSGEPVELPSGVLVTWENIPASEAGSLPPVQA